MHRTDAPGSVAGKFVAPDVATGVPGTDDGIDWRNDIQENVARAVERAGITLRKGTDADPVGYDQLADALNVLTGRVLGATKKNLLLNPGFDLWQASVNTPPRMDFFSPTLGHPADDRPHDGYTADQWYAYIGNGVGGAGEGNVALSLRSPGQPETPHGSRSELLFTVTTAATPNPAALGQRLELLEELDNLDLVLSAWVKLDAGTLTATPYVRQKFGSGGSADVLTTLTPVTFTTTRKRFEHAFHVPSIVGKTVGAGAYTEFGWILGGTTFVAHFASAQLEFGTVATEWAAPDLTLDLQACQRYFWKTWDPGTAVGSITEVGARTSDDTRTIMGGLNLEFAVPMRTVPALTWYSPYTGTAGNVSRPTGVSDATVTAIQFSGRKSSGTPTTAGVSSGFASAHLTADARL